MELDEQPPTDKGGGKRMTAYVVVVENMKARTKKVSQEAYSTLLQAQAFCMGRSDYVVKHNDYLFYDGVYRYEIAEIKII